MVIGFTGTRKGMTDKQKYVLAKLLSRLKSLGYDMFHHGDCVGSDEQAFQIATEKGFKTFSHPAILTDQRAFTLSDIEDVPREPLVRNNHIVYGCDVLIATPKGDKEEVRSGTWYTIRRARFIKRSLIIIFPEGLVRQENFYGKIMYKEAQGEE